MFGLSVLSIADFIKYRDYLRKDSYFTSAKFKHELVVYFNNIQALNGIYKDYSNKPDMEKVSNEELMSSKTFYDSNLRASEDAIENKYKFNILSAENTGNKSETSRLTVAKNKELDEFKAENTKTLEDFKKEIIAYKNKDYENIKKAVNENSIIKYYITKGNNKVIDTNIGNISDIDSYVKNNALYTVKFPNQF